jgi:hypothetical protein
MMMPRQRFDGYENKSAKCIATIGLKVFVFFDRANITEKNQDQRSHPSFPIADIDSNLCLLAQSINRRLQRCSYQLTMPTIPAR